MGSKRLTPTRVGKMASKCLFVLFLFYVSSSIYYISSIFVAHVSLPYNIAGLMHVV